MTRQSGLARWCRARSTDQQHLARFQQRHVSGRATPHTSREAPIPAVLAKLELFRGGHANLGNAIHAPPQELSNPTDMEIHTQAVTRGNGNHVPSFRANPPCTKRHARHFCTSRLGPHWQGAYRNLPVDTNFDTIFDRVYEGI